MDGASAGHRYRTTVTNAMQRCVGGRGNCGEVRSASVDETASSADLGGSSVYSNENLEDRSGEGFHVNSDWTWVSRS